MNITISDVIKNLTNQATDNYIKLFVEVFSIPISHFTINRTRLTANNITYLGLFIGIVGFGLSIVFNNLSVLIVSYYMFFILDYVDGKVARARGGGTPEGKRIDIIVDRTVFSFFILGMAYFNYVNDQYLEIMLVLSYSVVYSYIDILEYSSIIMLHSKDKKTVIYNDRPEFFSAFKRIKYWIPTRTSSPIIVILTLVLTSSFYYAFVIGIFVIVFSILFNKVLISVSK